MTIYIPPCDIVLVLVGRAIINILINNHISDQSNLLITGHLCQIPDTTMPVTGHPIKRKYTSIFKTYFNTINLPISLHNNINDLICIRCCWILDNGNFPLQTTLNMFTDHRPYVFLEKVMKMSPFIVSLK